MKPSHAANDNMIDRTRAVWKPRFGRALSHEDARQIVENVSGFFNMLAEWSLSEMAAPANDSDTQLGACHVKEKMAPESTVDEVEKGGSRP